MKRKTKKLFGKAKEIKLSSGEKNEMRENLALFIKKRPVRNEALDRQLFKKRSYASVFGKMLAPYLLHNKLKFTPMIIALIIALIVGGGTSFAAENALPGEILHPIKILVNEEVRSLLAFSDEAQAELEIRLVERRLEEAEQLAAEGKFNVNIREKIKTRFDDHTEEFEARVERIKIKQGSDAAFEAHSNFEAALKAHELVLLRLAEQVENGENIDSLLIEVRTRLKFTKKNRNDVEDEVSDKKDDNFKHAAEGKLKSVENKIREVRKFLEKIKPSISADSFAKAEAKLKTAEEVVARGKTEFEAGEFGKAFASFQEAHRIAQEAKLIVAAEERIRIEIKIDNDDDDEDDEDEDRNDDDADEDRDEDEDDDDVDEDRNDDEDEDDDRDNSGKNDDDDKDDNSGSSQNRPVKIREETRIKINLE